MLHSGRDEIDAGGFNGAVAQHVRQLSHIAAGLVKHTGEQVPQIVGEHLRRCYLRLSADGFHLRPNLFSGKPRTVSGEKYLARDNFLFFRVL